MKIMKPEISISKGLTIGYQTNRLFGSNRTSSLATAKSPISLAEGRHLLLARNGRGKTTLLKTLAGLHPALSGDFNVDGRIKFVDEDLKFDDELTPRQILRSFFSKELLETAFGYADRLELVLDKGYRKLSKGNRQKVALILAETAAADGGPRVLLLDEPFSGLDFVARTEIDAIWRENSDNVLRLICVHPDEPTLHADSAILIRDGDIEQVISKGKLDWLKTRTQLN